MAETIIEVENLSKLYKLGKIGTGTLSHDLNRWWHQIRGKEDPYLIAGERNDRTSKSNTGFVWSLKNLNFTIKEGEVFGIIGKNGAGKSTLLKILSKITKPTTGIIRLDGRIASLLEVGTGFHPELTGRENVYLNGAILGMTRLEINRKFDEIVNFSGVEKYIDTPVKRYSSGMYVRLAFAIAAHLEPEILIIDEVLAVGDAEFQQKCLGKMQDVSGKQGRTVLFVSHNISAIKQLCTKAILLEQGTQKAIGDIDDVLPVYQEQRTDPEQGRRKNIPSDKAGYFIEWKLEELDYPNEHTCYSRDTCTFTFRFHALETLKNCEVRFQLRHETLVILNASSLANSGTNFSITPGYYNFKFRLELPIKDAKLDVEASFVSSGRIMDTWASATKLVVLDNFESHLHLGLLNPDTQFYMEEDIVSLITR
jgi:lipopolysaccharide transport system ATP-binding protein